MRDFLVKQDLGIVLPTGLLLLLGTVILSSVAPSLFPLQFVYIAVAIFAFLIFASLDEPILFAVSPVTYPLILFLLVLTFLVGTVTRGSVRWLEAGPITFQPSEFAKPLLVLFFAWFAKSSGNSRFLTASVLFAIPAFLVFKQPDLGSTIALTAGFIGTLLGLGLSPKRLLAVAVALLIVFPVIFQVLAPYQRARIMAFVSPGFDPQGAGYNAIQAQISIGSGGLFGRGLGQGSQAQLAFLPERHSDFVFSALAEEMGFVAAGFLLLAFAVLFWRILVILGNTDSVFSQAVISGISAYLFAQTAINLGMNMGLLPITGIPLPLVSSGGSSLVSTMISLGIVNALSKGVKI